MKPEKFRKVETIADLLEGVDETFIHFLKLELNKEIIRRAKKEIENEN